MSFSVPRSIRLALVSTATSVSADVVLQRMSKRRYDPKRTFRVGSFAFVSAFPQNAYFDCIGKVCNGPLQKTMMNQFVFAPVNIAAGIAWSLALQNRAGDIKETVKTNIIPGLTEGAAYWIPLNMLIFSFVPTTHHFVTFKLAGIPAKFIFVARTTRN